MFVYIYFSFFFLNFGPRSKPQHTHKKDLESEWNVSPWTEHWIANKNICLKDITGIINEAWFLNVYYINDKFAEFNHYIVAWKYTTVFTIYILKYLGMKSYGICNFLSNGWVEKI